MNKDGRKGGLSTTWFVGATLILFAIGSSQDSFAQMLINVDFGGGLAKSAKVGPAAVGQSPNDFWNYYSRDDGQGGWRTYGALDSLKLADGTSSTVGLTVDNAPGAWGNGSSDPMYNVYIYPFGGNATVTISNLPVGRYDLYVYSQDGNYEVSSGNVDYGVQTTYDQLIVSPPVWGQGVQYALFQSVEVTNAAAPVVITVRPGVAGFAIIAGLQIESSSSTAAPVILKQPQDQSASVGSDALFTVSVAGTPPLSFQWQKDGAPLAGKTAPNLTLQNVQTADSGLYSVAVSNAFGSVLSSNATLSVLHADTNFLLNVDFGGGLTNSAKIGPAAVGEAASDFWNYYSRDDGHGGWRTSGSLEDLRLASGADTQVGLTVDNAPGAWGNGSSDPMYNVYIYPFGGNATVMVTNLPAGSYDFYVYSQDGNYQLLSGAADYGVQTCLEQPVLNPPAWREGKQYALFQAVPVVSGQPVEIIVRPGVAGYAIIAGLQITSSSGSAPELPPTIVSQPANQSVSFGSDATFTLLARGSGPLAYQWFFNGVALDGGTSYSLSVTNAQTNNAGPYSVVVSNAYGSVTSSVATLSVSQLAPSISPNPKTRA